MAGKVEEIVPPGFALGAVLETLLDPLPTSLPESLPVPEVCAAPVVLEPFPDVSDGEPEDPTVFVTVVVTEVPVPVPLLADVPDPAWDALFPVEFEELAPVVPLAGGAVLFELVLANVPEVVGDGNAFAEHPVSTTTDKLAAVPTRKRLRARIMRFPPIHAGTESTQKRANSFKLTAIIRRNSLRCVTESSPCQHERPTWFNLIRVCPWLSN
jgi:hypothetical protein